MRLRKVNCAKVPKVEEKGDKSTITREVTLEAQSTCFIFCDGAAFEKEKKGSLPKQFVFGVRTRETQGTIITKLCRFSSILFENHILEVK